MNEVPRRQVIHLVPRDTRAAAETLVLDQLPPNTAIATMATETARPDWQSPEGDIALYLGDCLDVLPKLPRESVDVVVTSPPYNQRIDKFKPSGMHRESRWVNKISAGYPDSLPEPEYQRWQVAVLDAIHSICSEGASCFYNHKLRWRQGQLLHPIDLVRMSKWDIRQEIVWARNGSCTMNARMFAPSDERIYWLRKGRHRWNQSSVSHLSVWKINSRVDDKFPCSFPTEIPIRCIEAVTNPGDLALDPFTGSGTTGVASVKAGRRFVGIEKNPEYFAISVDRIEKAIADRRDAVAVA